MKRALFQVPRAPRLSLKAPIAFRRPNTTRWQEGRTVNISRSGVLFVLPSSADVAGRIEFVINLSRGALHGPGVPLLPDLHCHGRVMRTSAGSDGETVIAACIRRQSIRKAQSFFVST
jgi:PilZ domain